MMLGSIRGQGLLAIFLVCGLAALERELISRSVALAGIFAATDRLDSAAYVGLFSTSAQIAGGFLGLYFASVSVVASTIYARVPGDVRSLIVSEKIGNVYIRLVALFGSVALLLLGAASLKINPGVLNIVLVVALGLVAVMSFVILGLRTFYFFDPAVLTRNVTQDIARWFRDATPRGYRWNDPSFQAHYQQRAEGALTTYTRITTLALQAEANNAQGIARLAQVTLALWTTYAMHKMRIPSDSHWFRRKYRHPDWFRSDYSRVGIAIETGTPLQAEATPDPFWLETELRSALLQAFQTLLDRDELNEAILVAESMRGLVGRLSTIAMLDESLALYREISKRALDKIRMPPAENARRPPTPELLRLSQGLVDVASAGLIEILLGLAQHCRATTSESLRHSIDQIDWRKPASLYAERALPRAVLIRLEFLHKRVLFEHTIEGRAISPPWYLHQLVASEYARFLAASISPLIDELEAVFAREAERFVAEERFLVAAQLVQRGLEGCEKFAVHLAAFEGCFNQLSELRRVPDLPWPSVEWGEQKIRVGAVRRRLIAALGKAATHLEPRSGVADMPDYFGQAYSLLAQEAYSAMARGEEGGFAEVFRPFFGMAFSAHTHLIKQGEGADGGTVALLSTQPLIDLLELSGYALIYSALDGRGHWDIARARWDSYLTRVPDASAVIKRLEATLAYRESVFGLLPRDLIRTTWKQDFERRCRERGLSIGLSSAFSGWPDEPPPHPHPIIRALMRGGLFSDPRAVFVVCYLMQRPDAGDFTLPRDMEPFAAAWKREQDDEPSDCEER